MQKSEEGVIMQTRSSGLLSRRAKHRIGKLFAYLALFIIIFVVDLPLISMVGTAFKNQDAVLSTTSLFPQLGDWALQNFIDVFQKTSFGMNIVNSAIVSILATVFCVIIAAMAGYGLSRFRGKFFTGYSVLLLLMQMFPLMLLLIPMFMLYSSYGMVNNLSSLVIYYTASNLAFNIMMIRSFFDSLPRELEEAAKVDGCSGFVAFLRIIFPISLPGLITVSILTFLNSWNEYTFASLLLRKPDIQTLTVGLTKFVQQTDTNWGYLMAASTIAVLPALLFLAFAQKYLVQGLTAGAVKG